MAQLKFVESMLDHFKGPYLEVGAHDYGNTQNIRNFFPDQEYFGVDMKPGAGVDICLDLTQDFKTIDTELKSRRFGTIFCMSVMEHVDQPFKMAQNLSDLLTTGGRLCVSVPFAWKFHGYPSDYWRFTHEGVKKLFPDLDFSQMDGCASLPLDNTSHPLDENLGLLPLHGSPHRKAGRPLRAVSAKFFKLLAQLGLWRWLHGYRYLIAPTMINMIGVKN